VKGYPEVKLPLKSAPALTEIPLIERTEGMELEGLIAVTKILFIEEDQTSFEIRRCIARVLEGIQPLELYHAKDATEALELLDEVKPDVVVIEHEESAEQDLFLDSLKKSHPPVIAKEQCSRPGVNYVERDGSLESIHNLLRRATELALLGTASGETPQ
jgi:DNA-binding NarL/FixJ family response regulator